MRLKSPRREREKRRVLPLLAGLLAVACGPSGAAPHAVPAPAATSAPRSHVVVARPATVAAWVHAATPATWLAGWNELEKDPDVGEAAAAFSPAPREVDLDVRGFFAAVETGEALDATISIEGGRFFSTLALTPRAKDGLRRRFERDYDVTRVDGGFVAKPKTAPDPRGSRASAGSATLFCDTSGERALCTDRERVDPAVLIWLASRPEPAAAEGGDLTLEAYPAVAPTLWPRLWGDLAPLDVDYEHLTRARLTLRVGTGDLSAQALLVFAPTAPPALFAADRARGESARLFARVPGNATAAALLPASAVTDWLLAWLVRDPAADEKPLGPRLLARSTATAQLVEQDLLVATANDLARLAKEDREARDERTRTRLAKERAERADRLTSLVRGVTVFAFADTSAHDARELTPKEVARLWSTKSSRVRAAAAKLAVPAGTIFVEDPPEDLGDGRPKRINGTLVLQDDHVVYVLGDNDERYLVDVWNRLARSPGAPVPALTEQTVAAGFWSTTHGAFRQVEVNVNALVEADSPTEANRAAEALRERAVAPSRLPFALTADASSRTLTLRASAPRDVWLRAGRGTRDDVILALFNGLAAYARAR